jgi:CheY-like chemotaxis protein/HPt (histidine-containing phosphotransfer) domain-containing protein
MKKIAVVEDNPDNRLLVRVILDPVYEVSEYETGFAALEGLQNEKPDLVLLDISLPEMDGAEVLRRIRADANLKNLPVIALTAHAMSGDREKYLQTGFDDYVTKPIVDENVLLRAIEKQLSGGQPATQVVEKQSSEFEAALDRLMRLGGGKFVVEMIDIFLDYTQTKIAEAQKALAAKDYSAVAKAVHPIKSSAGNIGANRVQKLAVKIEEAAIQQRNGELPPMLAELEKVFAEIRPAMEARKKLLEDQSE